MAPSLRTTISACQSLYYPALNEVFSQTPMGEEKEKQEK